jgi:hypothetical protein
MRDYRVGGTPCIVGRPKFGAMIIRMTERWDEKTPGSLTGTETESAIVLRRSGAEARARGGDCGAFDETKLVEKLSLVKPR